MDTRLRTRKLAGGGRLHYQQFDYSSSDPKCESFEVLLCHAPAHSEFKPPAVLEASMPPDEQNTSLTDVPMSIQPLPDGTCNF